MNSVWNFITDFINSLSQLWGWLSTTGFTIGSYHVTILGMLGGSFLVILGVIITAKLVALIVPN